VLFRRDPDIRTKSQHSPRCWMPPSVSLEPRRTKLRLKKTPTISEPQKPLDPHLLCIPHSAFVTRHRHQKKKPQVDPYPRSHQRPPPSFVAATSFDLFRSNPSSSSRPKIVKTASTLFDPTHRATSTSTSLPSTSTSVTPVPAPTD
jgi:hypothetical protein